MTSTELLDRIQGSLLGVAIGDALGMPVETMSHEQILAATNGTGITSFVNPIIRRDWNKNLRAGDTTDDWQLTRAVLWSLIRTKGVFDTVDCAQEHVHELDKSLFGWGKTTQSAIEAIKRGERIVGKDLLPVAAVGKGCGNGIIMKIAPLALTCFPIHGSGGNLWRDIRALGSITHPDIRASIAAYAVALLMQSAIIKDKITSGGDAQRIVSQIIEVIEHVENQEKVTTELVSKRLDLALNHNLSAEELRKTVGCGFHALETAAFVMGTFIRNPTDFRAGVLEAVNAGGDTDTNASIVGALIGANCGLKEIPKEWQDFSPAFQEPLDLGAMLFALRTQ